MELRNIHFASGAAPTAPAVDEDAPMRLRKVAVSPHEEYALREGQVAPISNELAAMICAMKGRVKITMKGIEVDRVDLGERRYYHHPDSQACNDLSYRDRKLFYVLNRQKPHVVHLLDDTGRYMESLPEQGTPGVLDQDAQAKALAGMQRQIRRMAGHLQDVHGKDTEAKFAEVRANHSSLHRVTQTLPAPVSNAATQPAASPIGTRIAGVNQRTEDRRKLLQSARMLGRGIALEQAATDRTPAPSANAEDWTSPSHSTRTPSTTSPIEQW